VFVDFYNSSLSHNLESTLVPYHATHDLAARSVLVLAPHPDDEVFGCGGALVRHVQAGCPVAVIVLTDGAFGSTGVEKSRVIETREAESCAAAAVLDLPAPTFWRLPDRGLEYGEVLIGRVLDSIRSVGADLIYAPALTEMHPDHRALAMIAVEAVRRLGAGVRLAMYEVGVPLSPNVLMDISDVASRKLAAMHCFASQLLVQSYDEHIVALNRFRTYTLPFKVRMAEAYCLHDGADLARKPLNVFASEYVRQSRLGLPLCGAHDFPLVSVVVRSMDSETLGDALDSISLQTYANIEVVVVNVKGGAHSDLGDFCGRYPLRLINVDGEPLSRGTAANTGLGSTTGELLAFLDDDDTLDPDHFACLVPLIGTQSPNRVVAYSGVRASSREGDPGNIVREFTEVDFNAQNLLLDDFLPIHALLLPKALLLEGVDFNEAPGTDGGRNYWMQLSELSTFVYSGKITATWFKDDSFKALNLACDQIGDALAPTQLNVQHDVQQYLSAEIDQMHARIGQLELDLSLAKSDIQAFKVSTSWRVTGPLRLVGRQLQRLKKANKAISYAVSMCGGYLGLLKHIRHTYQQEGIVGIKRRIFFSASPFTKSTGIDESEPQKNDYCKWMQRYDTLTDQDRTKANIRIQALQNAPLISIILSINNSCVNMLKNTIESVRGQLYSNLELCISHDSSIESCVQELLQNYAATDARIKVISNENGASCSALFNTALESVIGKYIALLENGDLLHELALFWVADAIEINSEAGLIYSDEDTVDATGQRHGPYFKPDWNPDLFLSHNMTGNLSVYRTDLVISVGGFQAGYEGSESYDLTLRCSERLTTEHILHIPRVLYHRRSLSENASERGKETEHALVAGQRAISDHFVRCHIPARVELLNFGMYRARYALPAVVPMVSLIIPTRDGLAFIKQCIESIFSKTTYENFEILIVDNNSTDRETLDYFTNISKDSRVRIFRDDRPFNYSALNNLAVRQARGEYIGLLNNDIEVISEQWLDEMVSLASQPGVGAVGARLWYPNNTLQHGGLITGIGKTAGHAHRYLEKGLPGYFYYAQLVRTLSAVTAACMVIKKSIFLSVGGFNETHLKIAFNDVDFCLRVREAGYRNIWTPYAELYHHESATRGYEDTPEKQLRLREEALYLKKRWGDLLFKDPAYSPNLTLNSEDFSFAWPPRTEPI
jgi:LmbE family N-acetylglucosaminyl deacetylase/glycosyltransferase involved in cell wall biosynthesis